MSVLETPYMRGLSFYNDQNIKCIDIKDRDGFNAFTCYEHDADELLKRINEYDNLQQQNKELVEALEDIKFIAEYPPTDTLILKITEEALAKHKDKNND